MIKELLKKIFPEKTRARYFMPFYIFVRNTKPSAYVQCGPNVDLNGPLLVDPRFTHMANHTRLQAGTHMVSAGGRLIVKKFSAIGADTLIVPGNHTPTVGLPQYLSTQHINDTQTDIIVEEDCWVGARSILLSHCHVGRGAIVAAGATVTKDVPPYSVVAGSPAKVIASRFTLEQVVQHERSLYPPEERMSREKLESIFATHFEGKRSLGTSDISDSDRQRLADIKRQLGITDYAEQQ